MRCCREREAVSECSSIRADALTARQSRAFWYLRRRPDKVASEIDEELRAHLDMRIDELTARGLSPDEARQEALRQFGDLEATRAYCRQQDLRKETHVQRGLLFEDLDAGPAHFAFADCGARRC